MCSLQSIFTTSLPPLSNCLTIGPSKDSFSIRSLTSWKRHSHYFQFYFQAFPNNLKLLFLANYSPVWSTELWFYFTPWQGAIQWIMLGTGDTEVSETMSCFTICQSLLITEYKVRLERTSGPQPVPILDRIKCAYSLQWATLFLKTCLATCSPALLL